MQVSPLAVPSMRITISGVPPFIPNDLLEQELRRFGKLASSFKTVSLGCKDQQYYRPRRGEHGKIGAVTVDDGGIHQY